MTQTIPITVYTADCTGNASNCLYPNKIEIADEASAKLAFSKDLVCARYKNNYRNIDNFELSNALPGDCDNEHSDDPQDWVTAEDVADLFADVPHVIHYSRHHMKQKGNKGPRPRFHVVLLIQPEQDAERYTALKQRLQAAFPFFDANAMDAARFLFGTGDPQVLYHPGTVTLNDFLDEMDGEQSFADLEYSIPEGSRNSTMSRIGARIIKRYGDTAEAKDLFFQAAQQCSPPLEDRELESIWAGKQRLYRDLIEAILSSDNEQQPISLDDGAEEVLETLFNEVEGRLKGDLAEIPDWAGKFVGSVLRISGILHVMKYPKDSMFDPVDRETMENAVTIGRYFLEHAKAAYSLMGADAVNKNARYLLSAIKRERLTEFSRRDAMRLCRRFKTAEGLQPVLDRLCEYGYLAAKPLPPAHGAGRKPSEIYLTNPAVLEDGTGEGRS